MHAIIVDRTFIYGDVKIFVASDAHERNFIGVGLSRGERGNVVFIEVRPETVDELESGRVGLPTVIERRGVGLIFEMPHQLLKRLRHLPHPQTQYSQPAMA